MAKAIHTVGRRKTSVARAWLRAGKGEITVNKRAFDQYYLRETSKMVIMQAFEVTGRIGQYDVDITVAGGGLSGQAGAIRHAISRALVTAEPELRGILKSHGLLTRDARRKERKLYGQPGARKRYQFSKR